MLKAHRTQFLQKSTKAIRVGSLLFTMQYGWWMINSAVLTCPMSRRLLLGPITWVVEAEESARCWSTPQIRYCRRLREHPALTDCTVGDEYLAGAKWTQSGGEGVSQLGVDRHDARQATLFVGRSRRNIDATLSVEWTGEADILASCELQLHHQPASDQPPLFRNVRRRNTTD